MFGLPSLPTACSFLQPLELGGYELLHAFIDDFTLPKCLFLVLALL